MESDFENWYALSTQSGRETRIKEEIENLTKNRYDLYLPRRELFYRFKGVYQKVVRPLFPGYIFIHREIEAILVVLRNSHLNDRLHPVLFDNEFAAIGGHEMELLMKLTGPTGLMKASQAIVDKDRTVVINGGPLKDIAGKVLYIDKRKRKAMLEIELLNRSIRVAVGLEVVDPKRTTVNA